MDRASDLTTDLNFALAVDAQTIAERVWTDYRAGGDHLDRRAFLRRVARPRQQEPDDLELRMEDEPWGTVVDRELEGQLDSLTPGLRWHVEARHLTSAGIGLDSLTLVVLGTALAAGFNTWVQLGRNIRDALSNIAGLFGEPVFVESGTAMLIAAAHIGDISGENDLSFTFSTGLGTHPPNLYGFVDGFAVGFRGNDALWLVIVGADGAVLLTHSFALDGRLPAWWLAEEEDL